MVRSAIAEKICSILSLKSEMPFVTKSKDACRWMLTSDDTADSGWLKMDWQLCKHVEIESKYELYFPYHHHQHII